MGFLTTQDRIGNVSYSSGIITLQPSLLTIGGQQYRTPTLSVSLSGLTANALYMVYVVMSGPSTFQLVTSTNLNSVGPNGFNKWKLVGALYPSSASAVGAFIKDLYGNPTTNVFDFTLTGSWVSNTTYTGKVSRDGKFADMYLGVALSGAPTNTGLTLTVPSEFALDFSSLASSIRFPLGFGEIVKSGSAYAFQINRSTTTIFECIYISNGTTSAQNAFSATSPVTFASGDSLSTSIRYPVSGFSDTPIAYL